MPEPQKLGQGESKATPKSWELREVTPLEAVKKPEGGP